MTPRATAIAGAALATWIASAGCQANQSPPGPAATGSPAGAASASGSAGATGSPPGEPAAGSSAAGSAGATGSPPGEAQSAIAAPPDAAPPPQSSHIALPRTADTPPVKTTRPLRRAQLDRLAALEFADFAHEPRRATDRLLEVRHTTRTRPILAVTVTIEPCDRGKPARRPCAAMDLAAWQARSAQLKQLLPPELASRPDTRFELGARDLAGATAIYTYQLGQSFGDDEHGQPAGVYTDAYILYYNDAVNQIRVNAAYVDDAVGGIDQLLALAPPQDLERLAVAFMNFYVHAWGQ